MTREEDCFGNRAAELAGIAAMLLGWRPREFWDSTPAELATALGESREDGEGIDRSQVERLRALFPDD